MLKKLNTNWFLINTGLDCNSLLRLEVNGYVDLSNQEKLVYLNSEPSYTFTGNEVKIEQAVVEEQATIATSQYSNVCLGNKLIERLNINNDEIYFSRITRFILELFYVVV